MTVAQDTTAILSVWGQTLTIRRKSPTLSDSGAPTANWATNGTATGDIQPLSGAEQRVELGEQIITTHEIFVANGSDVKPGDRVRPAAWSAGDDEYEVRILVEETPSHTCFRAERVRGHGG